MILKTLSFLTALIFSANSLAAYTPLSIKGQEDASKSTITNIVVPNKQATEVGAKTYLMEGYKNLLANPSFEHSTVQTSWTVADASISAETSDVIDGKQALKLVYIGDPVNLTQDSTINATGFSDGTQGIAYLRVKNGSDKTLYLCGRSAGVTASISNCATIPNTNKWIHAKLPVILGGTSNGIALTSNGEFTTGTILVDDAFLGAQDVKQDVSTCADVYCETEFSAKIGSTGTVSEENLDFINGNCSKGGTGIYNCSFNSGIFTLAATVIPASATGQIFATVISQSSTAFQVNMYRHDNVLTDAAFTVEVNKQGTDYTNAKARANGYITTSTNSNTDWQSCGHTTSDFTGFGTVTNIETQCKRDGSDLLVRGSFTGGTSTATEARMNLKFQGQALTSVSSTSIQLAGSVAISASTGLYDRFVLIESSSTYATFSTSSGSTNGLTKANGDFFSSGNRVSVNARIPINGWENSNVIVGSFKDLDYVYVEARGNAGQAITAETTNVPFIEVTDTHGAFNGTQFTAPVSGVYVFSTSLAFTTAATRGLYLLKSGVSFHRISADTPSTDKASGSTTLYLEKDDVITMRTTTGGGTLLNSSVSHILTITRIPGQFR